MHRPVAQRPLERRRARSRRSPSPSAAPSDAAPDRARRGRRSRFTGAFAPVTDTGSVITSVARLTALSGPITSTVGGSTGDRADDVTRAPARLRPPARPAPAASPTARTPWRPLDGVTCTTSTPNGTRTCSRRQLEQPPARARAAQIERRRRRRRRRTRLERARTRRAPARRRWPAPRRAARGRPGTAATRAARAAPRSTISLARHDQPQQHRQADRQQLQPEMAERPTCAVTDRGSASRGSARPSAAAARSARSRARSASAVEPALDLRRRRRARCCRSPRRRRSATRVVLLGQADRGAVPRCRAPCSSFGFTVSGRKQAAAATRSSCTITAPSCSGDVELEDADEQVVGQHAHRAECRPRCSCAGRSAARSR